MCSSDLYVVGETTFGKALVQSVYPIANGAGLALTTAHYYTPSNRLIQRPWDETFDEYLSYTQKDQDGIQPHKPSDLRKTDSGRPVYSGGGIEPDKYVPGQLEGFNPTPFGRALYGRQEFESFAQKFIAESDTRVPMAPGKGWVVVKPGFAVDDQMLADFKAQLVANHIRMDETAFAKDLAFIKAMVRFRIDEAAFGIAEARRRMRLVQIGVALAAAFVVV